MTGTLEGRVALVTGAASGIGLATALRLAREGATVVAADIDPAGLDRHPELHRLTLDVSNEAHWIAAAAQLRDRFGGLDVLVNNAGIVLAPQPVTAVGLDDWQRLMRVNVDGVFLGTKHMLPLLRESGGGSLINVSSIAGIRPSANAAAYAASKGAVRLFTKAVALECAAAGDGVRVNSVHPGLVETPIWDDLIPPAPGRKTTLEALAARDVPLGRLGRAEEIAAGILWLASDASSYMTGGELVLDGGRAIG
ncbi:SDR family NAD(P)-dependent oxidoreductase [Novosphingobium album (ex Liu et al. 2023)]|uniref:Glucose 1-dehydrogenase n=1 Tax=Novosphingobium album (ex Liu et al. 2023) TaxID=3031130 RepID=A0ABT5WLQ1_9SPHN|nr:glucose 1-dehydrogenase [Novosphingobium album (ex Liu et al. 2023)]MDE8650978.1 glucose 1-dehydrogenase [Novosphingobium album (ex Liu et al. 2023)]